ncbi:hypothetical protein CVT25_015191 [Psilocybe cyanescens]|uniref:Uncharacterized protein n=1 Tax=Psilocybe cyanescens TaxID=93625 RepID=A0A409WRM9_PSICY|nr:hypothetical protein CVT25_015191 [Psilocybe cyanescens]
MAKKGRGRGMCASPDAEDGDLNGRWGRSTLSQPASIYLSRCLASASCGEELDLEFQSATQETWKGWKTLIALLCAYAVGRRNINIEAHEDGHGRRTQIRGQEAPMIEIRREGKRERGRGIRKDTGSEMKMKWGFWANIDIVINRSHSHAYG